MAPLALLDGMPHQPFVHSPTCTCRENRPQGYSYGTSSCSNGNGNDSAEVEVEGSTSTTCLLGASCLRLHSPLIENEDIKKKKEQEQMPFLLGSTGAVAAATTETTTAKELKRRVSFATSVQFKEIPHINDYSDEDCLALWWNASDYFIIRRMVTLTVRMIAKNGSSSKLFDADDKDFCERGLEMRTKDGARTRYVNKRQAIESVLNAQEFQRKEAFRDEEYIAELYQEYGKACSEESYFVGLSDQKTAAELFLLSSFNSQ